MKKRILSIAAIAMLSVSVNAADIRPIISAEIGYESGTVDEDYTVNGGAYSESHNNDYTGASFRISGGILIPHGGLESRIQLYAAGASGEVEYNDNSNQDIDSSEVGISYNLLFGENKLRPFIGVEVGSGTSDFKDTKFDDVDYTAYGIYAGIVYAISDNLDFTARAGYKERDYDDISQTFYIGSTAYKVTDEIDYSGAEVAIGLTYKF